MKGLLEKKIRAVLASDTESRNSDIRLMKVIWWKYHKELISTNEHGENYVRLVDIDKLPREDHIARIRRKIQNDMHEFVPTSEKVALKRGFEANEWRAYLGYQTGNTL